MKDSVYMLLMANIYFAASNDGWVNRFVGLGFFVVSIMYMVGGR